MKRSNSKTNGFLPNLLMVFNTGNRLCRLIIALCIAVPVVLPIRVLDAQENDTLVIKGDHAYPP
ncbi:MAG: hypothetical protein ACOC2H_07265, partial [Spirochaetota bacterium]